MRCRTRLALWAILALAGLQRPTQADELQLDLPETVELRVLIDLVGRELKLSFLADEQAMKRSTSLRIHARVPREQLLPLLRRVLRANELALAQAGGPGWFQIIKAELLSGHAGEVRSEMPADADPNELIAVEFALRYAAAGDAVTVLTPYLSKPGGKLLPAADGRGLIAFDFVSNVRQIAQILPAVDRPTEATVTEVVPTRHSRPADLLPLIQKLLGSVAGAPVASARLEVDPLGRGILVVGRREEIRTIAALVAQLDQPVERTTEHLQPKSITAMRLKTLIEQLLPNEPIRTVVDETSNTLVVSAPDALMQQIRRILIDFDTAAGPIGMPMKFYKLQHRRAVDVFATLGGILGSSESPQPESSVGGTNEPRIRGASASTSAQSKETRSPTVLSVDDRGVRAADRVGGANSPTTGTSGSRGPSGGSGAAASLQGEGYSVTVDEHTNSIIAYARPDIHTQIEKMIEALDRRRPQVLVEVTLVSVTDQDSLDLGSELATADLGGGWDFLLATSFGLSQLDPTTGLRRVSILPGGTGVLIAPDEVPLIMRALQSRGNTRVYAAPRILVDDNGEGRIESVAESPFTSVNASDTVATTAFAGFAKAGTQLSIEPHIAEGGHLEIRYDLTVSSFTGAGSTTAPPPRSSDTLSSVVRVPDGHTVVIGGLTTRTFTESQASVPLVGDVPILGWLFGNRSTSSSKVRLYAFIRPSVMRQSDFSDLKYISEVAAKAADVPDGFPKPVYQYMR